MAEKDLRIGLLSRNDSNIGCLKNFMDLLAVVAKYGIYFIFAVTLTAALLAVVARNIFHAALSLVFALLGVAGVFFILHAEFIGAIQILLYVGGIMTLLIFAIMLTSHISDKSIPSSNRQQYPAAIFSFLLLYGLVRWIGKVSWQLKETLTTIDTVELGKGLMGHYVLPFEIISLVLVGALMGAIVIARSDS